MEVIFKGMKKRKWYVALLGWILFQSIELILARYFVNDAKKRLDETKLDIYVKWIDWIDLFVCIIVVGVTLFLIHLCLEDLRRSKGRKEYLEKFHFSFIAICGFVVAYIGTVRSAIIDKGSYDAYQAIQVSIEGKSRGHALPIYSVIHLIYGVICFIVCLIWAIIAHLKYKDIVD